jgi:hypothetical protein
MVWMGGRWEERRRGPALVARARAPFSWAVSDSQHATARTMSGPSCSGDCSLAIAGDHREIFRAQEELWIHGRLCNLHGMQPVVTKAQVTTSMEPVRSAAPGEKRHMCSAQLQESLLWSRWMGSCGFVGIGPKVWIGLDGSAMGGRLTGSNWTDREPSRVITSRSCAHKSSDWRVLAEFWQGPALEPALQQRVEKETDTGPRQRSFRCNQCGGVRF